MHINKETQAEKEFIHLEKPWVTEVLELFDTTVQKIHSPYIYLL